MSDPTPTCCNARQALIGALDATIAADRAEIAQAADALAEARADIEWLDEWYAQLSWSAPRDTDTARIASDKKEQNQ